MRVTVRSAGIDEAHAVLSIMQVAFSGDMAVGSVLSSRPYETGTDVDITLSKELETSGRVDPGLPRTTSW